MSLRLPSRGTSLRLLAASLSFALLSPAGYGESLNAVPFIGCASDGQLGPVAAPKRGGTPKIPAPAAARLAYYASDALGVLAPRGWRCFGVEGSNGSTLVVTPEPHGFADFSKPDGLRLAGPAVVLSHISGGTSGRFAAAKIAARLFPAAKPFVESVIAEEIEPRAAFVFTPYPHDAVTLRDAADATFETPAGEDGLGTAGLLVKNDQPVSGFVRWLPKEDNGVIRLTVRLPADSRDLSPAIVAAARGAP